VGIREQLHAFWSGQRPEQIPYTIYYGAVQYAAGDPTWEALYKSGLGVTCYRPTFAVTYHNVTFDAEAYTQDGKEFLRRIQRTPVGEIDAVWINGWHSKYWVETPADYRVMNYIAAHTEIVPDYVVYTAFEAELPEWVVAIPVIGRTPLQTILVDYVGLENFGVHLFEYAEEVHTLYNTLRNVFQRVVEIVAEGPGFYVSNLENFTAETLGPRRYQQFLLPVYEECFEILHNAGKIVGSHYDGRTKVCREQIARAPIDLIESLTPPPEGDQTLAECRAAWPDKLFWSNINIACYDLPPTALKATVLDRVQEATADGTKFAFEVSEDLPAQWRTALPIVLDALKETHV